MILEGGSIDPFDPPLDPPLCNIYHSSANHYQPQCKSFNDIDRLFLDLLNLLYTTLTPQIKGKGQYINLILHTYRCAISTLNCVIIKYIAHSVHVIKNIAHILATFDAKAVQGYSYLSLIQVWLNV